MHRQDPASEAGGLGGGWQAEKSLRVHNHTIALILDIRESYRQASSRNRKSRSPSEQGVPTDKGAIEEEREGDDAEEPAM